MASTKAPWMIQSVGAAPLDAAASSACTHGWAMQVPMSTAAAAMSPCWLAAGNAEPALRPDSGDCGLAGLQVTARGDVCEQAAVRMSRCDINLHGQPANNRGHDFTTWCRPIGSWPSAQSNMGCRLAPRLPAILCLGVLEGACREGSMWQEAAAMMGNDGHCPPQQVARWYKSLMNAIVE